MVTVLSAVVLFTFRNPEGFLQKGNFQFLLKYGTFLQEFTSSDMFYHDFRNHLVLFYPCISQCTGFNRKAFMVISPKFSVLSCFIWREKS